MNKKYTSIIIFGILILAVAGALGYSFHKKETLIAPYTIPIAPQVPVTKSTPVTSVAKNAPVQKEITKETAPELKPPSTSSSITLVISGKGIGVPLIENAPFYDTLVFAQKEGLITFNGKEYSGLGFFVTDIGTLHGGDGKNLLYYINGKEASVGVSTYVPHNGDVVEWRLN